MAEVIGLAASIAGVITLSAQVTALSYKYLNGVKNASKDINRLINELTSLSGILMALQAGASTNWTTRFSDQNSSDSSTHSIETLIPECTSLIEELQMKLEIKPTSKQDPTKAIVGVFRSLLWPVKEKETNEYVQKLERLKTLFTLAISVENLTTSTHVASKLPELERTIAKVATSQDATKKEQVLNWISCLDPTTNHQQASKLKTPATGQWLLDNREFQAWVQGQDGTSGRLWLHGMLGSGKSILISTVINYLKNIVTQHRHYGLAYFYFDFRENLKQDSIQFLASIVCQLLRSQPLLKEAEAVYDRHHQHQITASHLKILFIEATSMLDKVYIVVDALDECKQWDDLQDFILLGAPKDCKLHFLASSRKENYIEEALRPAGFSCIAMEEKYVDGDIALHVREVIANGRKKRFQAFSCDLKDYLCTELIARSKGSFRWVECQIDSISSGHTVREVRSAVTALPKTLNETYERILSSIREDHKETARRALLWLVLSKSPMTIREVAEAVKIEPRQFNLDREDFLLYPEALYEICPSMIVERSDGKVGLAHYSVQEYLLSEKANYFHVDRIRGTTDIASICLTYMLQEDLRKGPHNLNHLLRLYECPDSKFPLLLYASKNWVKHILNGEAEELVKDLIIEFLLPKQSQPSIAWQQVLLGHTSSVPIALHVAALFDLPRTLMSLIRDYDFNINQSAKVAGTRGSPLRIAVEAIHHEIAKILLEAGANPNRSGTLLYSSQSSVEMTELLLNYGAEFSERDYYLSRSICFLGFRLKLAELYVSHNVCPAPWDEFLLIFIDGGEWDLMNVLLDIGMEVRSILAFKSIVTHDHDGALEALASLLERNCHTRADLQPALARSAEIGKNEFIHLLLLHGADINDNGTEPPLVTAASRCQENTVQLLLSLGADPNVRTYRDINALQAAIWTDSGWSSLKTVRLLLENGADVNLESDEKGTALVSATSRLNWRSVDSAGDEDIVDTLLEAGAVPDPKLEATHDLLSPIIGAAERGSKKMVQTFLSPNVQLNKSQHDTYGYGTPLIAACRNIHPKIVQLLLINGADPNVHGGDAFSALHAAAGCLDWRLYRRPERYMNEYIVTQKMRKDSEEVFRILIEAGADPRACGGRYGTVLAAACSGGNMYAVEMLLALNIVDVQTGLMSALAQGHDEIARLMITHGADASVGAPIVAVIDCRRSKDSKMVKFLLKHGAKIDDAAILRAVQTSCSLDVVRVLLEAGADPNLRYPNLRYPGRLGCNLLQMAMHLRRWECVALLEEFGAKEEDYTDELE